MMMTHDKPHADLREAIERFEAAGELLRVRGADWNLEMGTVAEIVYRQETPPAILFEDIPGYPKGFRAISGATNSAKRLALLLGFPAPSHPLDVVRGYRDRMKVHKPIPPRTVREGPVLQNCGTYRSMVHGPDRVGLWMSPGKHGRQIREKYFRQGKACPVLISCGHDPLLFLAGGNEIRYGLSEYDYAAGHRGEPYDVIESELYGLPMPAHAEIVLEGVMHPGETAPEGPFGEFTGYYAGGRSEQPVVRVERIYHRNDPILGLACPMVPPSDFSYSKCVMKAGMIWDEVERAGLGGVRGVWVHEVGCARMFNVISIKQAYAGHSKQAALLAASCQSGSYLGRFVVVVDEDVDPANLEEVVWAMCTRCDPAEDIDFIRRHWSGPLDPRLPKGVTWNSRAVIDACRPFDMLKDFPPVVRASPALRDRVAGKFAAQLKRSVLGR